MRTKRLPFRAGLAVLSALCVASAVSASPFSIPNSLLASRDSGSCAANFTQCTNAASFPSDFCCSTGSTCVALAANTTLVCCPSGASCRLIEPITCNLSLQNATLHPDASVKTTALRGELVTCGTNTCCPFGYSCNSANQCLMNDDQSQAPAQSSASSSSTKVTSTSTSKATATSSSSVSGSSSTAATTTSSSASAESESATAAPSVTPASSGGTSGGVIAGAAIVVAAAGLLAVCLAAVCIRKRRAAAQDGTGNGREGIRRSTSSFGHVISAPIMTEGATIRSDFTRKSPGRSSTGSRFAGAARTIGDVIPLATRDTSKRNSEVSALSNDINEKFGNGPYTPEPRRPVSGDPFTTPTRTAAAVSPIRNMRPGSGDLTPWRAGAGANKYEIRNPFGNDDEDDEEEILNSSRQRGDIYAESIYSPAGQPYAGPFHPTMTKAKGWREPSSGTIDVFAGPNVVPPMPSVEDEGVEKRRFSHLTTMTSFSTMMRKAGLAGVGHGEPYVPDSAYSPHLKKGWGQDKGKGKASR